MKPNEFVRWIYPQAEELGEISPVFVTAQAALESGWGASAIGNNLFGITKGSSWTGPVRLVTTTEWFTRPDVKFKAPEEVLKVAIKGHGRYKYTVRRLFRDYATAADCLRDHLAILKKPGYADAWPYRGDPRQYVRRIMDARGSRYATSPAYVETMDKLFRMVERIVEEEGL